MPKTSDLDFAHQEFVRSLYQTITPRVMEVVDSIYNSAYELCEKEGKKQMVLMTFQNLLTKIPDWREDKVIEEADRIRKLSECADYIDDLLTACISSYIKTLSKVRQRKTKREIELEIPTFESFVHRVYVLSGRELWKNATLFQGFRSQSTTQKQKTLNQVEKLVQGAILDSIRSSVDIRQLLNHYFTEPESSPEPIGKVVEEAPKPKPAEPEPKSELFINLPTAIDLDKFVEEDDDDVLSIEMLD